MLKRLLLFLSIICIGTSVRAQFLPTLKVTSIAANGVFNFPDTIYGGTFYTYSIVVQNTDLQNTYTNSPSTIFSIKMQTDTLPELVLFSDSSQFTISPGDTAIFTVADSFPSPSFKLGNNVVVVWPSVTNGTQPFIVDSTFFNVYYIGLSGIHDFDIAPISIYPNPFSDYLKVDFNEEESPQLFIYDVAGKLVYSNGGRSKMYDLSFLKSGAYLLEVRKKNAIVAHRMLIKK